MTTHFTHRGFDFTFELVDDNDHPPPWEDGDGRGIVSDWRTGRDSKRPGERTLHHDRGSYRFYDWVGTIAKAKKEEWGLSPQQEADLAQELGRRPTRKQIIERSVWRDFEWMRRWCNDEWRYVGVVVTPEFESDQQSMSLWGLDSDWDDGITEARESLADELIPITRFEEEMRKAVA